MVPLDYVSNEIAMFSVVLPIFIVATAYEGIEVLHLSFGSASYVYKPGQPKMRKGNYKTKEEKQ